MSAAVPFELFASPFEGDFLGLAEHLVCAHARSVAGVAGGRLGAMAEEALTPGRVSTRLWSPELGAARMALARSHSDRATSDEAKADEGRAFAAAQIEALAFIAGAIDTLDVAAPGIHPLSLAGRVITGDTLRLRGEGGSLTVIGSRTGKRVDLRVFAPSGAWAERASEIIPLVEGPAALRAEDAWMDHWLTDAVRAPLARDPSPVCASATEAAALLREQAPGYLVWVAALLREIAPLKADPTGTQSQSFALWPGHVQISQSSLAGMVLALVHECSHQYFHLALWSGPAARMGAPEAHSILMGRPRPLEKLLLGFHAFGNVALAFDAVLPALGGAERAEARKAQDWAIEMARGLDSSLRAVGPDWLLPLGEALYAPLRRRLCETGRLADAGPNA